MTRLAQRSLTLQPGNSLASQKLALSVGFNMSIALHAATRARRLLALPPRDFPHQSETSPYWIAGPTRHIGVRIQWRSEGRTINPSLYAASRSPCRKKSILCSPVAAGNDQDRAAFLNIFGMVVFRIVRNVERNLGDPMKIPSRAVLDRSGNFISADLKDFLPRFLIPRKLSDVVDGQHVRRRRPDFFQGFHFGMSRSFTRLSINLLSFFTDGPANPE